MHKVLFIPNSMSNPAHIIEATSSGDYYGGPESIFCILQHDQNIGVANLNIFAKQVYLYPERYIIVTDEGIHKKVGVFH
jgi:hypothetical protein